MRRSSTRRTRTICASPCTPPALSDVKALVRANVDGLAHMVGNVDDELVDLLKSHPNVYFTLALGGLRRQLYAPWLNPPHPLISETVSPEQIKRLQDRLAKGPPANAQQSWERLSRRRQAARGGRRANRRRH